MARPVILSLGFLVSLAACGGSDGGDGAIDAPAGAIDAPAGPDAPARVTVSGTTQTIQGTSAVALSGATVEALPRAGGAALATATSAANGAYALTFDTGGAPVNIYIRARSNGRLDTYLYPPRAVTADTGNVTLVVVDQNTLSQLSSLGGVTYNNTKGFVALVVADAAGTPVAGATVAVSPAGSARVLYAEGMLPSSTATATDTSGTVYIPNTNTGSITVSASKAGATFQPVTFDARAGAMTNTLLLP